VVAAFGNLQVGVVAGRELDALGRQQVDEGIVRLGQVLVHLVHDLLGGVGAGDGQHLRVGRHHHVFLGTEAAGDDDLAVLVEGFADGVEGFLHRGVDEAAGVDDHEVGAFVGRRDLVALGPQTGEDVFGVDQGLGAAKG
jgi:hypothetical protein